MGDKFNNFILEVPVLIHYNVRSVEGLTGISEGQ